MSKITFESLLMDHLNSLGIDTKTATDTQIVDSVKDVLDLPLRDYLDNRDLVLADPVPLSILDNEHNPVYQINGLTNGYRIDRFGAFILASMSRLDMDNPYEFSRFALRDPDESDSRYIYQISFYIWVNHAMDGIFAINKSTENLGRKLCNDITNDKIIECEVAYSRRTQYTEDYRKEERIITQEIRDAVTLNQLYAAIKKYFIFCAEYEYVV